MPLPKVSEELGPGIARDMDDEDWLEQYCARLDEENPVVAKFLAMLVDDWTEEMQMAAMYAAVSVYRLLEAQVECDDMDKTIALE